MPTRQGPPPLGSPTRVDRGVQALVHNAREPRWDAWVEGRRDGLRPGRGCHEASQNLCSWGRPHPKRPWGLDADLAGACEHSGPAARLQALGHVPARGVIQPWRTAGCVEDARLSPGLAWRMPWGVRLYPEARVVGQTPWEARPMTWRSLSVLHRPRESDEFLTQSSSELPRSSSFLVSQPPHPNVFQGCDLYPALTPTCSYHSPRISAMILHMFRLHGPKGGRGGSPPPGSQEA
jgi:hypothetical protein